MLGPLDTLSAPERQRLLEALDWLVTYVDSDRVAALLQEDGTRRGGPEFADLPPASWRLLAEIAIESVVFPVAIDLRRAPRETGET